MKLKEILIIVAICLSAIIMLSSCNGDSSANPTYPSKEVMGLLAPDSIDNIGCIFRVVSGTDLSEDSIGVPTSSIYNYCWAYISDGNNFIDPASIKCNSNTMSNMAEDGTPGQFRYCSFDGHINTINWDMLGYLDSNYNSTDSNLPNIVLSSINYMDTLHKSHGITINYSGSIPTGNIVLSLMVYKTFADGHKEPIVVDKTFADNGSIYLSPEDLNILPITVGTDFNDILQIQLFRTKVTTEQFNGKTIVKLYETMFTTKCCLAL